MDTQKKALDPEWSCDPTNFPALGSLSPAWFFRRVPVYRGPEPKLEFIDFEVPAPSTGEETGNILWKITTWNMQWEAGPYRAFNTDDLPAALDFLRDLEGSAGRAMSDIVLIPHTADNIYDRWAPLYHLLPRETLKKSGLPLAGCGTWPIRGVPHARITTDQRPVLERVFAQHLWAHGVGRPKSPIRAFSKDDPLKLLAHDLSYWRTHMERLLREYGRDLGRVARKDDDTNPETIPSKTPNLSYEMPRFGTDIWRGEAEAAEVTRDLIDLADERGRLRGIMDAIRSNRIEEDFSDRWSGEREDLERKLYCKRNKVKVSFVEVDESIPYLDGDAELQDGMVYRNLLSMVDVKDRRVIVWMHRGMTEITDIAEKLGYANHTPVSKALDRIRAKAKKLLH